MKLDIRVGAPVAAVRYQSARSKANSACRSPMWDGMFSEDTVRLLMHIQVEQKVEREQVAKVTGTNKDEGASVKGPVKRVEKKVYPNDLCPCGSGKKYKNCCGRQA